MPQESNIFLHLALLVAMVSFSYGLVVLITPKRLASTARAALTGLVTTIVMHLYIVLFDGGVDQFVAISVLMGFAIGFGGGLALEVMRKSIWKTWVLKLDTKA